jgi:hypothetical protein
MTAQKYLANSPSGCKWQRTPAAPLGNAAVSFWGTPNVVPAGSKLQGSCRFGARTAMIFGKKLPLARIGSRNL